MGQYIAEFGGKFCIWSTVVDAPITPLMNREELRGVLIAELGSNRALAFEDRMQRVALRGCSARNGTTKADLLRFNKAGPNETHLATEAEIVAEYSKVERNSI